MAVTLPTYDSSKVTSTSLNPNQTGRDSGSTWTEDVTPINLSASRTIGFSFDFSINNESERNLALAPQIPFTTATDDLAGTGETATTWTLTLLTTVRDLDTVQDVSLYGIAAAAPSAWSDSNLASANLAAVDTAYLIETVTGSSSTWVPVANDIHNLVWNFDFHTNYTQAVGGAVIARPQWTTINNPLWNGLMQFILGPLSNGVMTFGTITFAGNTHRWHTGASGMPHDRRARVVHDYITNQTYMSDEAVADGYRHGIMVHPDNFDPVDPIEDNPFTPPPNEGVVDDDIIDPEG